MKKLVYGVGINDADYVVQPAINGRRIFCPYYQKWVSMLNRCYSEKFQKEYPTYIGCTVSESWKTFSNFKAWMETQDWKGKHLDKDLLFIGNKEYGQDTCVFISAELNSFLLDMKSIRGDHLIGVSRCKTSGRFRACCGDKGKTKKIGRFTNELDAHLAWKAYKHRLACELADEQTDSRVAEALRKRFAPNDAVQIAPETNKEGV